MIGRATSTDFPTRHALQPACALGPFLRSRFYRQAQCHGFPADLLHLPGLRE